MKITKRIALALCIVILASMIPGMAVAYADDEPIVVIIDTEEYSECGANSGARIWGPWETIQPATCTQDGIQQKTSVNGQVDTAIIPAFGHSMCDYPTYATCDSGGYVVHQCSTCGYSYTDSETGALGHDFGAWVTTQEATCTENGEQSRSCSRCGYTETQSIPSNGGHQMVEEVIPATCETGGCTEHKCSVCGFSYTDSETSALGHDYYAVFWTTVKNATCSEDGMKTRPCSRCGALETQSVPATGKHKLVNTVVAPTCTSEGYTIHECSVCGYKYTDSNKPKNAHSFSSWTTTKKATCLEEGEKTRTCSKCGTVEIQAITGSHTMEKKTVRPTCTSDGYTEHTCTVCGYSYRDSDKPMTDHTFSNDSWKITIKPSCFTDGEKTRKCRYCDATETCSIPTFGKHEFGSWRTEKSPTCITDGVKTRSCWRCNAVEKESFSDPSKHVFYPTTVYSTCQEEGYKQYVCNYCGFTYIDDIQPKSDHRWGSWELTKHRDCGHDGEESRTCRICSKTETRVLPKTGMHQIDDRIIEPTCQAKGYTEHKCWLCGYITKDHETEIVDCSFGPWTVQKQATCVEDGTSIRTCKWCGKTETRTDKATGIHFYKTTYVQPTCEEQGYDLHKCTMCGAEYRDNYEEPIGHAIAFDNKTATCQHDGYGNRACVWCGKIFEENVYIANSGHATEKTVIQATRTSHGSETWACKYCGDISKQTVLHYYVMTDAVPPSGNQEGYSVFTCTVCGDSYKDRYLKYDSFVIELANSGKSETEQIQDIANTISPADGTCLTYALRVANACDSCGIEYKIHHITDPDAMAEFGYTEVDIEVARQTGFFPNGIGRDHYWVTCVADGVTYTFGL